MEEHFSERLAICEANDSNIFHQLTEIKSEVKDIRRLTSAVEKIAVQTKNTAEKVAGINKRLDILEKVPTDDFHYYRRFLFTGMIGAVLGALSAFLWK
ncbi:MAG: hypothetical protein IJT66_05605 [Clostridia bacterium]|nr:hypothetical protein [Clostridia bacterium]